MGDRQISAEDRFSSLWDQRHRVANFLARLGVDPEARAEILNDTYLVAWRGLVEVPSTPDPAVGWLCEVARRLWWNHRRGETRRRHLETRLLTLAAGPGSAQTVAESVNVDRLALAEAWAALPEHDLLVLRLSLAGASLERIAEARGSTVRAATVARQRARAHLRSLIAS